MIYFGHRWKVIPFPSSKLRSGCSTGECIWCYPVGEYKSTATCAVLQWRHRKDRQKCK